MTPRQLHDGLSSLSVTLEAGFTHATLTDPNTSATKYKIPYDAEVPSHFTSHHCNPID